MAIIVAGMMRHVFALSGIDTIRQGAWSGLGIGLFHGKPVACNLLCVWRQALQVDAD